MKLSVLDHGYVEFVEAWGHGVTGFNVAMAATDGECLDPDELDYEVGIIEAARQSTQGSFRGWEQDEKLLKYLHTHKHGTPFEFAGMVIEVQAPIFVFREWHRHRTQSYNEMSARYAPLPDLYYKPTAGRFHYNIGTNKQTQGTGQELDQKDAQLWFNDMVAAYEKCEVTYQDGLRIGIPKELARLVMPVGHYSRMRASANLRNWLQFLTLRLDPAAQWEIRQYAKAVEQIIAAKFPQTMKLFNEGALRAS